MTKAYSVLRLDAGDLASRLRKIKPFMSTEETRYYLNGVYMAYSDGKLTLVATDGHRLQEQVFSVQVEAHAADFAVLCPRQTIDNLLRILTLKELEYAHDPYEGDEEEGLGAAELRPTMRYQGITMEVSDIPEGRERARISFNFDEQFTIIADTIDGDFPDYKKVIPKANVQLKTGFNAKYLKDVLETYDYEGVEVYVSKEEQSEAQPHLFASQDKSGIRCVLMPMRT